MLAQVIAVVLVVSLVGDSRSYPQENYPQGSDEFYEELKQLLYTQSKHVQKKGLQTRAGPPTPEEVQNWPLRPLSIGQVSGVAVNTKNQPVIFHRGNRIWDMNTFDLEDNYLHRKEGPIPEDTILVLSPENGEVLHSWGANMFYLPHGITIDHNDNYWITDVALHQVFKFSPGNSVPLLEFGNAFQPGSDIRSFCKPTSVAVASTGEVFIADGYCNKRILKYNAAGGLLRIIPSGNEFLSLEVPHALALMENQDRICIADRENNRIVCPRAGLRYMKGTKTALVLQQPDMGRVFGIAGYGNYMYAVNGYTSSRIPIIGFTADPINEQIIDHWSPKSSKLRNPHAVAVDRNGSALYIAEIGPNKIWKFSLNHF